MEIAEEWLVPNQNQEEFRCEICFQVNFTPMLLECKHICCESCVLKLVSPVCPFCRTPIRKDLLEVKHVKEPDLMIQCQGCDFDGIYSDLKDHFKYDCENGFQMKRPLESKCEMTQAPSMDDNAIALSEICQETNSSAQQVLLECGHKWHDKCREFWTRIGIECPLCDVRKSVRLSDKKRKIN
jgi:hypothetical protein